MSHFVKPVNAVPVQVLANALAALEAIRCLPPGEAPNKDQWAAVNRASAALGHALRSLDDVKVAA
jgi:hypothetical protein